LTSVAGVRLVWIIDPQTRTVLIRRANGTIAQARSAARRFCRGFNLW
jgi:hypothetical protein